MTKATGLKTATFFCALSLAGCVSEQQLLVNSTGQVMNCQAWGQGIIGATQAEDIQAKCLAQMRAAGYVEIERAGVTGLTLAEDLRVLQVVALSPAAEAGIRPNDHVTTIDGVDVHTLTDARPLLFGLAGSSVSLTVSTNGEPRTYQLVRKPWPAVFGIPNPASPPTSPN